MGNNLSKIRAKHLITQSELAKRMHVHKQSLNIMEKGKISVKFATRAAEILDENIVDILGTNALAYIPQTEEEKEKLIKIIKEL